MSTDIVAPTGLDEGMEKKEEVYTIMPIKDQGDRPALTLKKEECLYSGLITVMSVEAQHDDEDRYKVMLPGAKSYLAVSICCKYMQLCASIGSEAKGPEVKTLTDNRYEAFLTPGEVAIFKSIEKTCGNTAGVLKLLSVLVEEANYLGMILFVNKISGVIAITIMNSAPSGSDTLKRQIAEVTIPTSIEWIPYTIPNPNLLSTNPALNDRVNHPNAIVDDIIKPIDSDDEVDDEDMPDLESEVAKPKKMAKPTKSTKSKPPKSDSDSDLSSESDEKKSEDSEEEEEEEEKPKPKSQPRVIAKKPVKSSKPSKPVATKAKSTQPTQPTQPTKKTKKPAKKATTPESSDSD